MIIIIIIIIFMTIIVLMISSKRGCFTLHLKICVDYSSSSILTWGYFHWYNLSSAVLSKGTLT